jgi:hypothetical protein
LEGSGSFAAAIFASVAHSAITDIFGLPGGL